MQSIAKGGDSTAVEYALINPIVYYSSFQSFDDNSLPNGNEIRSSSITDLAWQTPVKAVIYYLTKHSRLKKLLHSLALLYSNFLVQYPLYPVVIFHDDLNEQDLSLIKHSILYPSLSFIKLSFKVPKYTFHVPNRTLCDPLHSTLGYRHMCRFHANLVYKTLQSHGLLHSLNKGSSRNSRNSHNTYIMRLDDDSYITRPIGYDLFRFMQINKKLYGYIKILPDDKTCVYDLWNTTRQFIHKRGVLLPKQSFFGKWPEPFVFYNNFEISHLSIWRSQLWLKYMKYIDKSGGIYKHR